MTRWIIVDGYEDYAISEYGELKSFKRKNEKIIKKRYTKDGYVKYTLLKNGVAKDFTAHRLVAKHFLDNPSKLETVNHIDGVKTNNHIENLEWSDRSNQLHHAYRLGLKKALSGSSNSESKLKDEDVIFIRDNYKRGCRVMGTVALGKMFGVHDSIIGKVVRRESYKSVQ